MTTEIPMEMLIRFWAKTTHNEERNPNAYHPLICHLIDVAVVAQLMWKRVIPNATKKRVARSLGLSVDQAGLELSGRIVAWLAGLHDLGKASPPFTLRGRCEGKSATSQLLALYQTNEQAFGFAGELPTAKDAPHGYVTACTLPDILKEFQVSDVIACKIAELIGGHHGTFPGSNVKKDYSRTDGQLKENIAGNANWDRARKQLVTMLAEVLDINIPADLGDLPDKPFDNGTTMILAGLVSVADWIGSDSAFFRCIVRNYQNEKARSFTPRSYFKLAKRRAYKALLKHGWLDWPTQTDPLDFRELFPDLKKIESLTLRPVQQAAIELAKTIDRPCLLVIEAPMGDGKTESAIYLADRLNIKLGQRGIYFALPTMATSNQMFGRVRDYLKSRFPNRDVLLQLQHGHAALTSDLKELLKEGEKFLAYKGIHCDEPGGKCDGSVFAAEWFTHRKRGLLSPFGVGTVDQALMAAFPTRHVFVRLFGLAHRTVIIDEVHAYDAYMSKLLERLLHWLAALGSPVILLSATLPSDKLHQLTNAYASGVRGGEHDVPLNVASYPRITWTMGDKPESRSLSEFTGVAVVEPPPRCLRIEWVDGSLTNGFPLGEKLRKRLEAGGCAAVICNTVDRAQQVYDALTKFFSESELDLFHARLLFEERERRERRALWRFGKEGRMVDLGDGKERRVARPKSRFVLVATQVIEQSLDLDFDLMISDFAPVDLLLQRSGRIWRHERKISDRHGIDGPALWLCQPEIKEGVPRFDDGTESVYAPYQEEGRRDKTVVPFVLLRSWLALTEMLERKSDNEKDQVSIPADIESLIDETYDDRTCPDELPGSLFARWGGLDISLLKSHWEKAKAKYDDGIISQEHQAEDRWLRYPWYTGHLGGFFRKMLEEDSPEIHQAHQALTRLGDSIGIICLDSGTNFDFKGKPTPDQTEKLLRRSVIISRMDVVRALRAEPVPTGWKKSALLRHYRLVILHEPVAGYIFRNHDKKGLLIGKETE